LTILVMVETPAVSTAQQPTVEARRDILTSQALAGNLFGDPTERTVYVLLPPGYATSDRRYPVVYVMPWGRGEPKENAFGFNLAMRSLLGKGEIEEMIVVVPDGSNTLGGAFSSVLRHSAITRPMSPRTWSTMWIRTTARCRRGTVAG
jgi:enterochelin esterase-like enzyme